MDPNVNVNVYKAKESRIFRLEIAIHLEHLEHIWSFENLYQLLTIYQVFKVLLTIFLAPFED